MSAASNILLSAFAGLLLTVAPNLNASAGVTTKSVIELFTSQGCSSCPPADALLAKYTKRNNVIALSYNVDYWDYLGWRDTLGKRAFTDRQRAYALARGDGKVYTPQIIANGLRHAVGSDPTAVERALERSAKQLAGRRAELNLASHAGTFIINVGHGPKPEKPATVYIAAVSPSVTVKIGRGENHGETITYHNVVRKLIPVGMWSGEPIKIRLRDEDVMNAGGKRCVVLVQTANAGPVLAAGWMPE